MVAELLKLGIISNLSGGLASGVTSVTVRSGITGWPTNLSGQFRVICDSEGIILQGGPSPTYNIIARGAEGSPQTPHNDWAEIFPVASPQGIINITGGVNDQENNALYVFGQTDRAALVRFNANSIVSGSLPTPALGDTADFGPHWWTVVANYGSSGVTLSAASGSLINNLTNIKLGKDESSLVFSDGSGYKAVIIGRSSGAISSILSGQIVSGLIGNAAVVSGSIASGQIAWPHLSSGTVRSGHIADSAINSGNIASGAIGSMHLSSGIVQSGHIGNTVVTSGNISSGSIAWMHLSSGAVNSGHVANGAVNSGNISSGSLGTQHLGNSAVLSGNIGSGQIAAVHIQSGTLLPGAGVGITPGLSGILISNTSGGPSVLTSGQVVSGNIGNNAVNSGNISSGSISNFHLASGSVVSGHLNSGAIALIAGVGISISQGTPNTFTITNTSGSFALTSGIIQSGHIGNNAVNSGNIASGSIGTQHLANNSVLSGNIGSGQVAAVHIQSGTILPGAGISITPGLSGILIINLSGGFTLTSGIIVSGLIGNGAVTSGNVASGQIGNPHLANNSVLSGQIGSGQVAAVHVQSGALLPGAGISISPGLSGILITNLSGAGSTAAQVFDTTFIAGEIISGVGPLAVCAGIISGTLSTRMAMASVSGRMPAFGIIASNYLSGSAMTIYLAGQLNNAVINFSGWNALPVYVGRSGQLSASGAPNSSGDIQQIVGIATQYSGLMINIGDPLEGVIAGSGDIGSGAILGSLGGGYFNIASGTIGTSDLANGSVRSGNLGSGQVTAAHIVSGTLLPGPGISVTPGLSGILITNTSGAGSALTSGVIVSGLIGNGAVNSGNVSSGALGTQHLGNSAVLSGNIGSGQVAAVHIQSGTLLPGTGITITPGLSGILIASTAALASGSVQSGNIGNAAVTSGNIASGQIGQMHLSSGAVSSGHLASGALIVVAGVGISVAATTANTYTVTNTSGSFALTSGIIVSGLIGNNAVNSGNISSGVIGSEHIGTAWAGVAARSRRRGIILGSGSQLEIVLSGPITTAGVNWEIGYTTVNILDLTSVPNAAAGLVSGTTAVQMIAGPASGFAVDINHLSVYNNDSAQTLPRVRFNASGIITVEAQSILTTQQAMYYDGGWYTISQLGATNKALAGVAGGSLTGLYPNPTIANNAVLSGTIGSGQVAAVHISSGTLLPGVGVSVTPGLSGILITNLSGGPSVLTSGQVVSGNIGDNAVVSGGIGSGQIGRFHLSSGIIVSGVLSSGAYTILAGTGITVAATTPNAFTVTNASGGPSVLTSGQIVSGNIGNNAVTSGNIASGQLGGMHLASGSIASGHLASGALSVVAGPGISVAITTTNTFTVTNTSGAGSALTSGIIVSGLIGDDAVNSGNITTRSLGPNHFISGMIIGYIYGLRLNYITNQQVTVGPGLAIDASGINLMSLNNNFNIFISGTTNGSGNLDASPIGAAAQFASGFIVSGFWMSSGFLWPIRSGTGLMAISGVNVAGASGTDFLKQVSVNDLIGVHNSGYWRVTAVNSGVVTIGTSGSILSGSMINIIENAFIGMSGRVSVPVNNIRTNTVMTTASGLWSGSVSGICFIGGQPGIQVPLHIFIGQGNSGTACFMSTQRTTPLVSGMIGYV